MIDEAGREGPHAGDAGGPPGRAAEIDLAEAARDAVLDAARAQGFHRVAIVPVEAPRRLEVYRAWVAGGNHGEMAYLAAPEHLEGRADLTTLLSGARTLIVVALAYGATTPAPDGQLRGSIARYARGTDYHMIVRDKLLAVAEAVSAAIGHPVAARPCVDSAPVLEREAAERAGLGFVAKNTMLIAPGLGSYVLLGELLLDVDVAATGPDQPPRPRCGGCRACLDACPTAAFTDAYVLDARRCISYLTIEHRGVIPRELRPAIGTMIFGCDICQEVCPFNAGAASRVTADPALMARSLDHATPDLVALAGRGANQLRQFTKRTAMRRIDRPQLLRNVAVALGNTADPRALAPLVELLGHATPLVRGHAAWALGHLLAAGVRDPDTGIGTIRAALVVARAVEEDPEAIVDLDAALSGT